MDYLLALLLIGAGLLGASSLIVAKKPDARRIIDALVPFQALIGAGTLVLGVLCMLAWGPKTMVLFVRSFPLMGATMWASVIVGVVLGLMFAVPLMGRLGAGQQKAAQLAQQLAPYQLMLGVVAILAGLMLILFRSGILPPNFPGSAMM